MIQLIASTAIQRLKAAIPRERPGQLSTVKEEEKVDNGGGDGVSVAVLVIAVHLGFCFR